MSAKTAKIKHFITKEVLRIPLVRRHNRKRKSKKDGKGPPFPHNDDLKDRWSNHEPETNSRLVKLLDSIPDESMILEAGAHIGDTTFLMATYLRKIGKHTKIRAFEPDPNKCEYLELVKELNGLTNVEVVNAGLSDELSTGSLDKSRHSGAWTVKPGADFNLVTIDSMEYDVPVSLIKLDVEGYEHRAIQGGLQTIRQHQPLLCVERIQPETLELLEDLYDNTALECIDTFLTAKSHS